jgi:hypothetical protein
MGDAATGAAVAATATGDATAVATASGLVSGDAAVVTAGLAASGVDAGDADVFPWHPASSSAAQAIPRAKILHGAIVPPLRP